MLIKRSDMIKKYCDFCKREVAFDEELGKVHCGHYIVADEVCRYCLDSVRQFLIGWQKSKGYCKQDLLGKDYGVKEFSNVILTKDMK
jgi:hypothetical protein